MPRKKRPKNADRRDGETSPLLADVTGGDQLANILDAAVEVDGAKAALFALRETLKEVRAALAAADKRLGDLLREARDGLPLQNAASSPDPPSMTSAAGEAAKKREQADWRAVRLDSLTDPHIKGRYLKALAEHDPPIVTLGDWTDWVAAGDFCIMRDVPGLGEAARANIDEATAAFWAKLKGPDQATA